MKKMTVLLLCLALLVLSGCGAKTVQWNGETEVFAELFLVADVSDPWLYAGLVTHIFAGTVTQIEKNVLPAKHRAHEESYSSYRIRVEENLKGELSGEVTCRKLGGFRKDGTMLLVAAELPDGTMVADSGLPEEGKTYIFMAYAQPDGSLILSELFDSRECSEALLDEYRDYAEHSRSQFVP